MSINHVTKCVKFYQYDETDDCKKLIINVDIEDIVKNNYSLNYNEYIEPVQGLSPTCSANAAK